MPIDQRHTPQVFCLYCHSYLGLSDFCGFCGRSQPPDGRVPEPGQGYWATSLSAPVAGELALAADAILTADSAGRLHALDLVTGAPRWPAVDAGAPLHTHLALSPTSLYVGARREPWLAAFDLDTGANRWRYPLTDSAGPCTNHDNLLIVGDSAGQIHFLHDLGDRAEPRRPPVAFGYPLAAPPLLVHGALILAAQHHLHAALVALDMADRQVREIWRYPISATRIRHLVQDGDLAWLVTDRGHLHAVKLPTGRAAWPAARLPDGPPDRLCPPLITPEAIWLGAATDALTPFDRRSGQPLAAPTRLAGPVIGLAVCAGLLVAATQDGRLLACDPTAPDAPVWSRSLGCPPTASLLAAPDRLFSAATEPDGSARLMALPWHGDDWRWGSRWAERQGELETAAALAALVNDLARASELWLRAGRADLAGAIWHGRGRDAEAGATFRQAADQISAAYPQRAAGLYSRAANSYERADLSAEAEACRRLAGRQGRFADLVVHPLDPPDFEAGQPGLISIRLENRGNDPASRITFELRGPLEKHIKGWLDALPAQSDDFLDFEGVTPTRVGEFELTFFFKYEGAGESGLFTELRFPVRAGPPPDLDLRDDAGSVIVRVPPGAPLPRVRARKMVGMIKFEVV